MIAFRTKTKRVYLNNTVKFYGDCLIFKKLRSCKGLKADK